MLYGWTFLHTSIHSSEHQIKYQFKMVERGGQEHQTGAFTIQQNGIKLC